MKRPPTRKQPKRPPTRKQIAAATRARRDGWTDREHVKRVTGRFPRRWTPPVTSTRYVDPLLLLELEEEARR
jgi:hypothetical protein